MYFKNILVYLFSLGYPFFSISSTIYIYILWKYLHLDNVCQPLSLNLSVYSCAQEKVCLSKKRKGRKPSPWAHFLPNLHYHVSKQNPKWESGAGWWGHRLKYGRAASAHWLFHPDHTAWRDKQPLSLFNAPDHCINTVCFTQLRPALYQSQNYWRRV